jgi:hypothetical protein
MAHYRIVQTGEGFKVQDKFLWFFWMNCAEPSFGAADGIYVTDEDSTYWIYDSYNDAMGAIERLKHMFYEYKGHTIQYGYLGYTKIFVDLNSKYTNYKGNKVYRRYARTLDEIKMDIDREIREEEEEKNSKKVIKIYNVA